VQVILFRTQFNVSKTHQLKPWEMSWHLESDGASLAIIFFNDYCSDNDNGGGKDMQKETI